MIIVILLDNYNYCSRYYKTFQSRNLWNTDTNSNLTIKLLFSVQYIRIIYRIQYVVYATVQYVCQISYSFMEQSHDICLVSSRIECYGHRGVQALATGIPTILSQNVYITEYIVKLGKEYSCIIGWNDNVTVFHVIIIDIMQYYI